MIDKFWFNLKHIYEYATLNTIFEYEYRMFIKDTCLCNIEKTIVSNFTKKLPNPYLLLFERQLKLMFFLEIRIVSNCIRSLLEKKYKFRKRITLNNAIFRLSAGNQIANLLSNWTIETTGHWPGRRFFWK